MVDIKTFYGSYVNSHWKQCVLKLILTGVLKSELILKIWEQELSIKKLLHYILTKLLWLEQDNRLCVREVNYFTRVSTGE